MASRLLALFLMLISLSQSTLNQYETEMSLGGTLFLVNREYVLASDYQPDDLVKPNVRCTNSNITMRKEAAQALEGMFQAAQAEGGYTLIAVSGFRSYGQQTSIFERKVKNVGKKKAMLLVAPPGTSEHQLGLAMDVGQKSDDVNLTSSFGKTKGGKWVKGPGMDFINALKQQLPNIRFIAEDLGTLTQEVLDLRDNSGYPGMKVLGFAFDGCKENEYLPHNYPTNSVCYTGTHDNMTTLQWFHTASYEALDYIVEYLGLEDVADKMTQKELVWSLIKTAMASVSDLCIVQMQDYLTLGEESRMNFPGTMTTNNWTWRAWPGFTSDALAERIAAMTKRYGRAPAEPKAAEVTE